MDIKTHIVMQVRKEARTYTFSMEVGSPFGEAYDAAFQVLKDITELSKQAVDSVQSKTPENFDDTI